MATIRSRGLGLRVSWTEEVKDEIKEKLSQGWKPKALSTYFGVTDSAIYGIIHVIKHGTYSRSTEYRKKLALSRKTMNSVSHASWDSALFEPWSVYSARKKKERADARKTADQRGTGPQDAE